MHKHNWKMLKRFEMTFVNKFGDVVYEKCQCGLSKETIVCKSQNNTSVSN